MEEAKAASKKDHCQVLKKIARAPLQSADEPLFRALADCGLAMTFDMKDLELDTDFSYPCFPPKEMLQTIAAEGYFHKVLGVPVLYSDHVLPRFWEKYQVLFPEHDIFRAREATDFKHLLPFYVHGDGGRTYKKDSLMVLSFYNALGEGTSKNQVELQPTSGGEAKRRRMDNIHEVEPGVNLRGNTLTNRFLFTAMKTEFYKENPDRFQKLLSFFADYLAQLFQEGFEFNGDVWRVAILGVTGDAPFLREAGNHTRSFSNVSKKSGGRGMLKGCCWLCEAGRTGGPCFEDVRICSADWVHTCGRNNPLPWSIPGPFLGPLPVNDSDLASFYRPDIFHIFHAGVGKDFGASALIYIMKAVFKRRNIHASLEAVNSELKTWKQGSKEHLHFGKLTLDLLGYSSSRSYPVGHWSKNMDTAPVIKFVEYLCLMGLVGNPKDEFLETISDACGAIAQFMHILFSSSFYLTESQGWQLIQSGQAFLNDYMKLAVLSFRKGLCLWKLKPKLHMLTHIVHTALQQFKKGTCHVINPLAEAHSCVKILSAMSAAYRDELAQRNMERKSCTDIWWQHDILQPIHPLEKAFG